MRVTHQSQSAASVQQLQHTLQRIQERQAQVASGKRVTRMSDDPTAATDILHATGILRKSAQYLRNQDMATAKVTAEESALDRLTEVLTRVKELAFSQADDSGSSAGRSIAKVEIDELLREVAAIGNTKLQDLYLFGGANASSATPLYTVAETVPGSGILTFTAAGTPAANLVEIGPGHLVTPADAGDTLFLAPLTAIRDVAQALATGSTTAIRGTLTALDSAIAGVQDQYGVVGARQNAIDAARLTVTARQEEVADYQSSLADIDIEQAVIELSRQQTSYQAALLATSRAMQMSLADYLR